MLVHGNFHQISQCSSTTASSYVCITSLFEVDPRHCCQCVELSFSTFETDLEPFCLISNIKGRLAGHGAIAPVLLQVFIIITIRSVIAIKRRPVCWPSYHHSLSGKLFCYHLNNTHDHPHQMLSSPMAFPLTLFATLPILIILAIKQSLFRSVINIILFLCYNDLYSRLTINYTIVIIRVKTVVIIIIISNHAHEQPRHVNAKTRLVSLPRGLLSFPHRPHSLPLSQSSTISSSPSNWRGR